MLEIEGLKLIDSKIYMGKIQISNRSCKDKKKDLNKKRGKEGFCDKVFTNFIYFNSLF